MDDCCGGGGGMDSSGVGDMARAPVDGAKKTSGEATEATKNMLHKVADAPKGAMDKTTQVVGDTMNGAVDIAKAPLDMFK